MESSTAGGLRTRSSRTDDSGSQSVRPPPHSDSHGPSQPDDARRAAKGNADGQDPDSFLGGLWRSADAPSLRRGRVKADDEAVRRALVRHLATHSKATEKLSASIALILCLVLTVAFPVRIVLPWMAAVGVALGLRSWVRRKLAYRTVAPQRFLRAFRWTLVPVGLAWAAGPVAMAGSMGTDQLAIVLVLYAGLSAAATASLAADRRSFTCFILAMMGPTCVAIALGGVTGANGVLAGLVVLFTIAMKVLGNRAGQSLDSAVRTQEALRRSEQSQQSERALLDSLINSAPTAIVVVDSRGRVLGLNPAFESLFGWTPEDALGRDLDSLVVAPVHAREAARLFDDVNQGKVVTRDVYRCDRHGRSIPVRLSAAPAHDALIDAVFVLYEDRSAEVRAYAALQQTEEHYRELVESSLDLVWKVDVSGRWTFLNAAALDLYGADPSDLVGTSFAERVAPERRDADLAALRSIFEGQSIQDYETVHRARSGPDRHLSFTGRPIRDESGAVVGAQGTARDVTERVAIRAALEEARELALHNANHKTAFLANMSHEIRTPLNAVTGMIEILMGSNLDESQRRQGEVIRGSAQALLTLVDDILDFSKLESGNMRIEAIPYSVPGLVESTTRLLAVQAEKKGLEIRFDIDPAVPARASGDPGRIRQVLMNLLGNAIKFTHEGAVSVRVEVVGPQGSAPSPHTGVPPAPERLMFRVSDTGIGISADKVEAIFDHFTQADASTTRQYGGTGLGLAICQGLVGAMHGGISVESTRGVGSEFSFWTPLVVAPEPEVSSAEASTLGDTRALVVEAEGDDRTDIEALLMPLGVSLATVGNAQEALAHATESAGAYDFVLLDRAVSGMDGFELASSLRAVENMARVPIVMLSSEPRIGEGARCRQEGVEGYLPKPINRGDLLEIIVGVLRRADNAGTDGGLVTRHSVAEARPVLHILLVEDNVLNQEVASALLTRRGHTVDVVDNGADAVQAVQELTYDLVLMDIQLPGIDGVEATRQIRATERGAVLPIVALTAHAFGAEQERALAAGMNDFLTKPFRPHDLFGVVEGWQPAIQHRVDSAAASGPPAGERPGDLDEPPVDLVGFRAEMREVGIECVVDESLALFLSNAPDRIRKIVQAADDGDLELVSREAHGFKSAAGTIRANRLHALLDQLEDEANDGHQEAVATLVPQVADACAIAVAFVDEQAPVPEPA